MADTRYKYHYTPAIGWINDPNGLIYADGQYHLFCQYYPDDTHWGPMHWAHAVSEDLLNWKNLPVAIVPTEDEYAFSGSAVLDHKNVSGMNAGDKPTMFLYYTAHNPKTGEQQQCIAYSSDYVNFTKYENNPVIRNTKDDEQFKKDFRDPKVITNTVIGGFTMVLAAGDRIEFYHSKNLLDWTKTGEFEPAVNGYAGICECPDLIKFETDEGDKYVLTMSMVLPANGDDEEGHLMQYFVGDFDGKTFTSDAHSILLDYGENNYAAVTFAETSAPIMMGWGEDWNKARKNTNIEYFGKMTCARKLDLAEVDGQYYLRQTPIWSYEKEDGVERTDVYLAVGEKYEDEKVSITNLNEFVMINDLKVNRFKQDDMKLTVIKDNGFYEVFVDNGLISYTQEMGI